MRKHLIESSLMESSGWKVVVGKYRFRISNPISGRPSTYAHKVFRPGTNDTEYDT